MSNRSYKRTKTLAPRRSHVQSHQTQTRPFVVQPKSKEQGHDKGLNRVARLDTSLLQNLGIQTKLTIGQPDDKYEQEADHVATQVVERINTPQAQQESALRKSSQTYRHDVPSYLQAALANGQSNITQYRKKLISFRQKYPNSVLDGYRSELGEPDSSVKIQQTSPMQQIRCMGRAKNKANISKTDFDKVAAGNLKKGDAPKKLTIPKEFAEGMKKAWGKSFPGGKSQEQGGILVKNKDGSYEWKAGKAGTSGTFSINYGDQDADEALVASAHTHPYDKSEGGYTDVSFSGADLANLVSLKENLKMVQSGDGIFVVSRTQEFDAMVKKRNKSEKQKLKSEMKKTWNDSFKGAKGKLQQRVEVAVKAVCSKYHLVYYKGKGGKVTKQ
jgi:hypothetical protein